MNNEEGGTSTVSETTAGFVTKRLKRKRTHKNANLRREKSFHKEIYTILETEGKEFNVHVPELHKNSANSTSNVYTMKKINTKFPLSDLDKFNELSEEKREDILNRLKGAISLLGSHGIILKDAEAFLQPDFTIMLIDFGQVYRTSPTSNSSIFKVSGALFPAGYVKGGRRETRRIRPTGISNRHHIKLILKLRAF